MACSFPLYRIPVGSINFGCLIPSDQARAKNGGVFVRYSDLLAYREHPAWSVESEQVLRCGQCSDCRLAYSRDWAIRCSLEASLHEHNYFITLTYDDLHLPRGEFVDYTGTVFDSTLRRRDIQLFIKKYREFERDEFGNTGIKVFYCGEYGDLTSRPHYHLCLFGCSEIPDLTFGFRKGSYDFYKSSTVEKCWSSKDFGIDCPRGFVDISECSFDSIAYTARYIFKKQKGVIKKDFLELYDTLSDAPALRVEPFIGMSRRPGLASSYFEANKGQILSEDLVKYTKKYQLFSAKPPRYFDKLFERESASDFAILKQRRSRLARAASSVKSYQTSESVVARAHREALILVDKENKFRVRGL